MKQVSRNTGTIFGLLVACMIVASPFVTSQARASIIPLGAVIDGPQANAGAGSGSPGTGTADILFNDVTSELSWNIVWADLIGDETVMHFHGPAFPNQNAGVQVDVGGISGISSPSIGSTIISAGQAADLQAGLWYINIHTTRDPGGEIRGQVVPEPGTLTLMGAAAGWMIRIRRKRRASN